MGIREYRYCSDPPKEKPFYQYGKMRLIKKPVSEMLLPSRAKIMEQHEVVEFWALGSKGQSEIIREQIAKGRKD